MWPQWPATAFPGPHCAPRCLHPPVFQHAFLLSRRLLEGGRCAGTWRGMEAALTGPRPQEAGTECRSPSQGHEFEVGPRAGG